MKLKSLGLAWASLTFLLAIPGMAAPTSDAMRQAPVQSGGKIIQFPSTFPKPASQPPGVDGGFNYKQEQFFVHVPPSYTGQDPYGLIVFVDPGKSRTGLPDGWEAVLEQKKLLFIAPQNVGNDQHVGRRNGMAVTSALAMMRYYNIDRTRVYAAGFSGGARIASTLGFYEPDLFKGTIQSCGTDFHRTVPKVTVTSADTAAHPEPYGVATISAAQADLARARVKFVMITGPNDFRYRYIQDIYNGGFKPDHYKALLLDINGMGHAVCGAPALESALDFLSKP